jgi:hypothetical protein
VNYQIQAVEFLPDGVAITYFRVPNDIRKTGLQVTHQLIIPATDGEYDDEILAVLEAVEDLLRDAAEDLNNLEPYDPATEIPEEDEDDDDPDE